MHRSEVDGPKNFGNFSQVSGKFIEFRELFSSFGNFFQVSGTFIEFRMKTVLKLVTASFDVLLLSVEISLLLCLNVKLK